MGPANNYHPAFIRGEVLLENPLRGIRTPGIEMQDVNNLEVFRGRHAFSRKIREHLAVFLWL